MSRKKPFEYFVYDLVKVLGALPGLIWFRPRYVYESEKAKEKIRGGALVISNHGGYCDPIYLLFTLWYRRPQFVCLKKFTEGKMGWLFRAFRCIPIDKENPGLDTVREVICRLKDGNVVVIFPEGSVNLENDSISQFKSGVSLMAMKSGKPVVPVFIREKKHWYERLTVIIGERVETAGTPMTFGSMDGFAELLLERERGLKNISDNL